MKLLKPSLAIIAAFVIILFVCSNMVSALSSDDISATPIWAGQPINAGTSTTVRIAIGSNYAQQVEITSIGIHFDWMNSSEFVGKNFASDPLIVRSMQANMTNQLSIVIPANVSSGTHTLYIEVEGTDASGVDFVWDSPNLMVDVAGSGYTAPPTGGNGSQNPTGGNMLLYGAIIVALVVVALVFLVILIRKRKKPSPAPTSSETAKDTTQPEEKTEKPAGDEYQI